MSFERVSSLLLEISEVTKLFDGFRALHRVSLRVSRGEARALIGPNGAGKSTLLKVISGEARPDTGKILFDGRNITGLAPHVIARLGLVRTFQISNLFENLSVRASVRGALTRGHLRRVAEYEITELLALLGLSERADRTASELSHGERRLLEVGLALAQRPKLCLLDEPTAGLSPSETQKTVALLQKLKAAGHTLLIVEHDISVVQALADTVTVLHQGCVVAEGTPDEVAERVQHIYNLLC